MKTRKEIENRLAELNALIAEDDGISAENNRLFNEAERQLKLDLKDYLKEAGYPVNELTSVDVRMWGFTDPVNRSVSVGFKSKDRSEFTVTFRDKKIQEVNATGISSRGTVEDLNDMESYYKMVAQVMERLNSKYFSTNMVLFFETLESFTYPEMKAGTLKPEIREERNELKKLLRVLDLELEVGKTVEVYIEGTNRWRRSRWTEATIERMTEKMIYINSKAYGTKAINRNDVLDKIRIKPCQAQEA